MARRRKESTADFGMGELKARRADPPEDNAVMPRYVKIPINNIISRNLIVPPENFSLRNNYDEVVSFLQHFRNWIYNTHRNGRERKGVDFRAIKRITPGAALILAGELFRWQVHSQQKLAPVLKEEWDPAITRIFNDFGLFEFLNTRSRKDENIAAQNDDIKFIKYRHGVEVTPTECSDLLDHLTAIVGAIEAEKFIFDGLVEALNNVKHHAYPKNSGWHGVSAGTWLMCGAYSPQLKVLTAAVYDMGVGIPSTLPRSGLWEQIKGILAAFGANDDSSMIAAAMQAGRSRTGLAQRGKGLPIMMRLFDHVPGHLRILSGHGEVRYRGGDSEITRLSRPLSLGGTLVQWQIDRA